MRTIATLIALTCAGTASACPSFGFSSPHLSAFFCGQIDEIAPQTTRSMNGADRDATLEDDGQIGPDWLALPQVERAWRADPAKTLRLIERIRDAGGRPVN